MDLRRLIESCAATAALALAMPALAGTQGYADPGIAPAGPDLRPAWHRDRQPASYVLNPEVRGTWLAECRRRLSARDDGWDGALLGGVVGGFAGNRIAGRRHRLTGALAGAAVGAAAGRAIDRAEDRGLARDQCEVYLDDYYAYHAQFARAAYGHGHPAYAAGGCCQPAIIPPRPEPECTETVDYVDEYVPARPPARRVIPARRAKIVPDKRVPIE